MKKLTVGILGGSFDPITIGHLQIANSAMNLVLDENYNSILDEVWFLPCYEHSFGKKLLSPEIRIEMMKLQLEDHSKYRICEYEIFNKSHGSTYETLVNFNKATSGLPLNFYYIIGADNTQSMENWIDHEKLINEFKFIVVPRPGYQVAEWAKKEPHIISENQRMADISSTKVRQAALNEDYDTVKHYVGQKVGDFIQKNKLYCK